MIEAALFVAACVFVAVVAVLRAWALVRRPTQQELWERWVADWRAQEARLARQREIDELTRPLRDADVIAWRKLHG